MAFKMKTTKGGYTTTLADKIISQKQPISHLVPNLNHNNGLKKENHPEKS